MPEVVIPRVLSAVTGGARRFDVPAGTLEDALVALFDGQPQLRVHVFDERGHLRPHVRCYVGDRIVDEIAGVSVRTDTTITILQAVSGG